MNDWLWMNDNKCGNLGLFYNMCMYIFGLIWKKMNNICQNKSKSVDLHSTGQNNICKSEMSPK